MRAAWTPSASGFIEGGWPGAIPKDTEFFRRARTELDLRPPLLTAFGATRRPDVPVSQDPQVRALLAAETPVVTLVAKSHTAHVDRALRTTLAENLAMIRSTVRHLVQAGRRVFLDAEHYFDGYVANREYALEVVRTAAEAGAETVVLCDTNGGSLPEEVKAVVADTIAMTGATTRHPLPRRHRLRGRQHHGGRRRRAPCTPRAPRTATANAVATPTCSPSSRTWCSSAAAR